MKYIIINSIALIFLLNFPSIAQQNNNSLYLSQSTPGEMIAGKSYGMSVSMKNTGRTIWEMGSYSLKLIGVKESYLNTWGVNNVDVNSSVRPGEDIVFNFTVKAPEKEGEYMIQWQMAEGNAYFGEPTIAVPIRVSGPLNSSLKNNLTNNDQFVSQAIPTQMEQGQVYDMSITVMNTGSSTWTPNEYKLRVIKSLGIAGDDGNNWSIPDITLPYEVVPGSQVLFVFKVVAPDDPGTFLFQCNLVKDGVPFGETSSVVKITVN